MNTITSPKIKKMSPLLLVADIDRSIEFYTKKLAFKVDFRYEDFYCGIIRDDCSIHLKSGRPSVEERKNRRSNEDLDIIFSVEGVEKFYDEMLHRSTEVVQPLRVMPYGKEFYIADPDGYIIGFTEEA
jgi:catechol 2,3-dioxygenase-like lactoylglutathione lyase family enzyme